MRLTLTVALVLLCVSAAHAQAGRRSSAGEGKKNESPRPAETPKPAEPEQQTTEAPEDVEDDEAVTVETNLVTLPVVVSDRGGRYVPDLKAEEFTVTEDGAEQKVSFFATVSEPFHVVLMIDTSASTTAEKMRQVQEAAVAFINQLTDADRVKVISFDDFSRELFGFAG